MTWHAFLPQIGEVALSLSLAAAAFALVMAIVGVKKRSSAALVSAERSLYSAKALVTLSVGILVACLFTDNFLVRYVYGHSNRAMPTIYKFTALWGGQEGSLLFWLWLSSIFGAVAVFMHRDSDRPLIPYVIGVFGAILSFFGSLLIYSDNPFRLFPEARSDGLGLNPLLQNPSMAIHPPSLYLGYVGMSVPFAFAMGALISNRLDSRWIVATRIWVLISWFFLSIGNLLGAQWAYTVLGWGGFWGWDPVENAAILPWFTASAFLHSVMIQEKRGMLKFWNMNLIVISFCLTILGTYLTRSGVVQSVHSFARSPLGWWFLGFLIFIILFSALFIFLRRSELRSSNIFESFFSKESAFVVNNIVLVGTAFIILWCTLFPTASEILIGTRIVVGPPFFNKMLAPLAIVLLILTGIGPIVAWRKATPYNLRSHFLWPTVFGLVAMSCLLLLRITHWYAVLTGFGAAFVFVSIVQEFYRGAAIRMSRHSEKWLEALVNSTLKNNRKYGGYIVHLGIVFIFVGIAGTAYKQVIDLDLKPGQEARFKEYTLTFSHYDERENLNQLETYAVLDLWAGNKKLGLVRPARFFYKQQQQPTTIVDIVSRLKEDVYFTLGEMDPESGRARVQVTINPFISWLWIGGLILAVGGLIAMIPPGLFAKRKPEIIMKAA